MIPSREIYEALVDDEAFSQLPIRLAREFGARSAIFGWHFSRTDPAFLAHNLYFEESAIQQYLQEFALSDPWTRAHVEHPNPNRAVDLALLAGTEAWERSAVYNEWIRPMGDDTFHCAGLYVTNHTGHGSLVMHRGKTDKPFDQLELARITAHAKPVRRMLSIRSRLAAADHRGLALQRFAEAAGPTIVVDRNGLVLNSNHAGELLLRAGTLLKLERGRLRAAVPATPSLELSIQRACAPADPDAELVLLRRPRQKPVTLTVIPVSRPGPAVAMLFVDRVESTERGESILARRFGLSAAETDIATRVAEGQVIKQIAEARGVSPHTVKVQITSIMAKLGCSRQIEIAALVDAALRAAARFEQINGEPSAADRTE